MVLLATAASAALASGARAANYNNTTPVTNAGPSYTLGSGDTLNNSSGITSTGAGQAAVLAGSGVSAITNSGVIQGTGANGLGIQVVSGGSVGSITNSGTVQATGFPGNAILVGDTAGPGATVGTITNTGLIQSTGGDNAIYIAPGSSIGSIINSGTIQPTPTLFSPDAINVAGTVGTISNSGLIQAFSGEVAIRVEGTVGTISNAAAGTIQAVGDGNAIYVVGTAGATGSVATIANAGLIQSTGTFSAISVNGSASSVGSIVNSAGGTIQATGTAQAIKDAGNIASISNSGTIQVSASQESAIDVYSGGSLGSLSNNAGGLIQTSGTNDAAIRVGGTVGSIANAAGGTIQSTVGGNAIYVVGTAGAAGSVGTITNAGLMQSIGTNAVISTAGSATIGTIVNNAGGVISSLGTGAGIYDTGTIGSIGNSGTIQGGGNTDAGVVIASGASLSALNNNSGGLILATGIGDGGVVNQGSIGTLSNAGTILVTNGGTAAALYNIGSIGSIVNSGSILAPQATGIELAAGNTITGGITNTASGLIQGGPSDGSGTAIDDSTGTNKLTIGTAGTIIGAIRLGPAGDTLNVTGGSITGAIIGQAGSGDLLAFSPAGTFATGGSISNVDSISVAGGTVAVQQPVSGAQVFAISPAAAVILNSSVGAASFQNAGLVSVGTGSQTITGNYTQASSGALGITVTSSTVGALTVTGNAAFQGTLAVAAHVPTSVNDFALTGTNVVLSANTITATGGSLVASSDNSGIGFNLADTGTQLLLSPAPMSSGQIESAASNDVATIFAPLSGFSTPSQVQAQHFLQTVFVGLATTGRTQLLNKFYEILTLLPSGSRAQFNDQLLPDTIENAGVNLDTTMNVLSGSISNIMGRLETARLGSGQTGLAAGDAVGRGITFWGRPFGALTNQAAQDGVDGYSAATYGITLGGDEMVAPHVRAGVAVSLSNSDINYNGSLTGNTGNEFTGEVDLYGMWFRDNVFVDGLLSFGYNHYSRHNLVSALGLALDSSSGGTTISGKIGAGYDYHLGDGAILTPYGSLQQFHFNFGSYTTTGGSAYGLDMHVNGASQDMTQSRLGAKLAYPVTLQSGGVLTPNIHLYWLHDFGSNQMTMTYTSADFASPNTFYAVGPQAGRDTINIGVGATFAKGPGWSIGGGYDYAGRSSLTGHNFYVVMKLRF